MLHSEMSQTRILNVVNHLLHSISSARFASFGHVTLVSPALVISASDRKQTNDTDSFHIQRTIESNNIAPIGAACSCNFSRYETRDVDRFHQPTFTV
jgi:hypothetical protein